MAGVMASIARLIRSGSTTPAEIAERTGITRGQLMDRLFLMERQGYLARQKDAAPDPACSCGHCCSSCSNQDSATAPVLFVLTQKGERLAKSAGE